MRTLRNIIILASLAFNLFAQDNIVQRPSESFSLGFNLNQFQKDFGLGINATSPFFFKRMVAVRASVNYQWLQYIPVKDGNSTWKGYPAIKLGVVAKSGYVGNFVRLYSEGGLIILVPNSSFSSNNLVVGGYGLFGFEFYPLAKYNYFIELGGVGTDAVADKAYTQPIYSYGFMISVGFRCHFK